ncbi:MAG TPA: 3-deoxy-D-manno-octulosonic acid transferase [Candidatus Sulfotelmatobacter sp.]|nr:3-deoxy-D-manno-octulosonic acid transferase [Candidatus Sulfotelmatobacter sp.]
MSVVLRAYRSLAELAAPLVRWHLSRRATAGKEEAARIGERFGRAGLPRPAGSLVWLHAASVGEAVSILPLAARLTASHPQCHALVTTGTVTSAVLLAQQLPPRVMHQYAPVDLPAAADRFLDHWRPDLILWAESEFWPNLLGAIAHRGIPLALVNGRVSERAFRRWQHFKTSIRSMLGAFSLCLGQTPQDAARLQRLGAARAACVGNLKFSAAPLSADAETLESFRRALAMRPRWLAASTHAGEEAIVAEAHRRLQQRAADVVTFIAPRHPERGGEIAALLAGLGLKTARRSLGQALEADTQVYLADTIGELGLWYRLADVVFVGGSLAADGGHNPLEPARLGAAVLHGPGMASFAEIAAGMRAAGAGRTVADAGELADAVGGLLFEDAAGRRAMAAAAKAYAESQAGVLDRVIEALAPLTAALDKRSAA